MHRFRTYGLGTGCAVFLFLGSCSTPPARSTRFVMRQTSASSTDVAFEASEQALLELNYVVASSNKTVGLLKTRPILGGTPDRPPTRASRVSSANELRSVAEIRVETQAEEVLVYCRVLVQEQTNQAHRAFARDQYGRDTPTETAIDMEAGATAEQNSVWRTIGQDASAERRILSAITRRIDEGA